MTAAKHHIADRRGTSHDRRACWDAIIDAWGEPQREQLLPGDALISLALVAVVKAMLTEAPRSKKVTFPVIILPLMPMAPPSSSRSAQMEPPLDRGA